MITFEAGKSYATRSIGDHDCIVRVRIAKRTAHTVVSHEGKRFRIGVHVGVEQIRPWGSYSMCPILKAADAEAAAGGVA